MVAGAVSVVRLRSHPGTLPLSVHYLDYTAVDRIILTISLCYSVDLSMILTKTIRGIREFTI